jgi:hypothetical protein
MFRCRSFLLHLRGKLCRCSFFFLKNTVRVLLFIETVREPIQPKSCRCLKRALPRRPEEPSMSSPRLPEEHDGSTPLHRPALPASSLGLIVRRTPFPGTGPHQFVRQVQFPKFSDMPLVRELLDRSKMSIVGMGISPVSRLCLRMTLTSLWHDDARLDRIVLTKWLLVQLRQCRTVLEVVGKLLGDVVVRR